ncbi:RHS repeat-associated core domain-containing protein, partial [Burkholderia ubonensis]|uniref:RHS repeat-associated core domain-containing protein n=1 Tax=Burkholderia ubonensis TaxID=101571 RepID=UPI000AEB67DF
YDYGYRHYAPWLARWLNPDPAGTVDGLNLFRMVRNNPVTLVDSDGHEPVRPRGYAALASTFKRGDIVYGLDKPRQTALRALEERGYKRQVGGILGKIYRLIYGEGKKNIIIQNDITNAVWSFENPMKYSSNSEIRKKVSDPARGIGFRGFLEAHHKYNVASTTLASRREPPLSMQEMKKLWKKTSKAGLEYQIRIRRREVHFVVETIIDNIDAVVSKRGHGESITSSELRWLYRHRDTEAVRSYVRFWGPEGEVARADVFDPLKWRDYTPKNRYDVSWGS